MADRGRLLTYRSHNNRVLDISILDLTNRYCMACLGKKNITNRAYVQGALPTAAANIIYWNLAREIGVTVGYSF
jgi:hypothetical protein